MHPVEQLSEDAFGHWLAGFIDGEGSFVIRADTGTRRCGYGTRLQVGLRADDGPLLNAVHRRTNLGSIYFHRPYGRVGLRNGKPLNAKPQVLWVVHSKAHCARLVQLLDRYPLVSKKARDYTIWRKAVVTIATKGSPMTRRGPRRRITPFEDWSDLAALKAELESVRAYIEPSDSPPAPVVVVPDPQLSLPG